MDYLQQQKRHWETGYIAPNVESFVFRFYGRILKPDFGIDGSKEERLLDFGCGQGAAVNYFHRLGFNAYGVDISEADISVARQVFPEISEALQIIDPKPRKERLFFGGNFACILSIQTLYYLSDTDLGVAVANLHNNMRSGGVFYVTMMSAQHTFYDYSGEAQDGLREVHYDNPRRGPRHFFINFTESEEHLINKFSLFEPIHVGFYSERYRQDEGVRHHYTFVGIKR